MIYKWSTSFMAKGVDAQVAGERLARIGKRHDLTPRAVLDDAVSATSPLHPCFDWNDVEAADKWRLEQAGQLIRSISVVVSDSKGEDRPVRAFVHVTDGDQGKYLSVGAAMNNIDYRQQVIAAALRELQSFKRKYADLKELADVLSAIDRVSIPSVAQAESGVAAVSA